MSIRVIPCLLLKAGGLVKSVKFQNERYVGDPLNAVRVFNEKEVDELIFLDITATVEKRSPNFEAMAEIASECFMPLAYGGGISKFEQVRQVFNLGVEKVIINAAAFDSPDLIREVAEVYGSQSVVVSIDVKKSFLGKYSVYTHRGKVDRKISPVEHAKNVAALGAGEIFLNSIERDGTGTGYDLTLIRNVSNVVGVPVVACGGAGGLAHFQDAVENGASAVSAGSLFVYYGKHKAVLITYPTQEELRTLSV